jgi:hypothetical protein
MVRASSKLILRLGWLSLDDAPVVDEAVLGVALAAVVGPDVDGPAAVRAEVDGHRLGLVPVEVAGSAEQDARSDKACGAAGAGSLVSQVAFARLFGLMVIVDIH